MFLVYRLFFLYLHWLSEAKLRCPNYHLHLIFFAGGVPAFTIFKTNLDNLSQIVDYMVPEDVVILKGTAIEICIIGLVAYFEAFLKDHFASLINIYPPLIARLKLGGHDVTIDSTDLLRVVDGLPHTRIYFG